MWKRPWMGWCHKPFCLIIVQSNFVYCNYVVIYVSMSSNGCAVCYGMAPTNSWEFIKDCSPSVPQFVCPWYGYVRFNCSGLKKIHLQKIHFTRAQGELLILFIVRLVRCVFCFCLCSCPLGGIFVISFFYLVDYLFMSLWFCLKTGGTIFNKFFFVTSAWAKHFFCSIYISSYDKGPSAITRVW